MILDDLEQIKIELMQDDWDRFLINLWRTDKNCYTGYAVNTFLQKNNLDFEYVKNIKRMPKFETHMKTRVTRFIAAYLPKLNDALFNKNNSDESILKYMKSIDTLNNPVDAGKKKKEEAEFRKASKEAMAEGISRKLVKLQRLSSSGHDWKTVK